MKKLSIAAIGLLSVASLSADDAANKLAWVSELSLDTQLKFQTEHATRGRIDSRKVFAPSAELGYSAFENGRIYLGFDSAVAAKGNGREDSFGNFVSPYIGITYDITEMFSLDAGYVHNFWTGRPAGFPKRNTNEIYVGVMADVVASPALYGYYDFDRREIAIEGSASYFLDLSDYYTGLGLDFGAKVGFDRAKKPYGQAYNRDEMGKKRYFYYGLSADVVYSMNDNAKVKVGVEFAGNSAKKNAWPNFGFANGATGKGHKAGVWCNASIDCSF